MLVFLFVYELRDVLLLDFTKAFDMHIASTIDNTYPNQIFILFANYTKDYLFLSIKSLY